MFRSLAILDGIKLKILFHTINLVKQAETETTYNLENNMSECKLRRLSTSVDSL